MFFDKYDGNGRSQPKSTEEMIKCSTCLNFLELAVKFRITQLRNFGRQAKRLTNKMIQIGSETEPLQFLQTFSFVAKKGEKAGGFVSSDEILKDILFGVRKTNIDNNTR